MAKVPLQHYFSPSLLTSCIYKSELSHLGKTLVDLISTAHPTLLTKEEIDAVAVPVQILAPENDPLFTPELKEHANRVIPTLNIGYMYQFFPGMAHGFATKCDSSNGKQRRALEIAKNAAVGWFAHLH